MKQQRLTLTRGGYCEMLRTQPYERATTHGPPDFGLCDDDLRRYFNISPDCMEIDVVLSTREYKDSYAVKQADSEHIEGRDPADTLWVDEEFAAWIGKYAKAANREWVYLSFEYPKGC